MASEPTSGRVRRAAAKIPRIAGIALAAFVVVGIVGLLFVSSRYFTAAVERELARVLMETKQRTLRFDGPLEISFWPNAGFKVGRLSLSEAGSAQEFATVESARFSVAVAPLLAGQVTVDQCAVEGLHAAIVRYRDGTLNIDDLLASKEPPSSTALKIDMASGTITNSMLSWFDEADGKRTEISDLDFAGTRVQADTAAKTMRADALALGGTLSGLRLRLGLTGLAASPKAVAAERASLDAAYKTDDAEIGGTLQASLTADPEHGTMGLDDLTGSIDVADPRLARPIKLPVRGALHAGRNAADGDLSVNFDESKAALKLKVLRYSPLSLHFDADIDNLDVDRYLSANHVEPVQDKSSTGDLSGLKAIDLDGTARIGTLQIAGIRTNNIKLEIRREQGRLDVRGHSGK